MSNLNVNNISDESGVGNNLILAADGRTTIPGGTNRPQIVGYQQGAFLATVQSEFGGSKWIENGAIVADNAYTMSSFTWWRIGQLVTVNVFFRVKVAGNDDDEIFMISGYPYKSKLSDSSVYYQNFVGAWAYNFVTPATAFPTLFAATINLPKEYASDQEYYTGESSILYFTDIDINSTPLLDKNVKAGGQIAYTLSYLTEDTTWQPINGATVDP